jgi:hypothetical protein
MRQLTPHEMAILLHAWAIQANASMLLVHRRGQMPKASQQERHIADIARRTIRHLDNTVEALGPLLADPAIWAVLGRYAPDEPIAGDVERDRTSRFHDPVEDLGDVFDSQGEPPEAA